MSFEARDTLCIYCRHACTRGCSLSDRLKPVKGWTAEENIHGYKVLQCPQFQSDGSYENAKDKPWRIREIDRDGMINMMEAAARLMTEDYIKGKGPYDWSKNRKGMRNMDLNKIRKANRKLIEKWLLEGDGARLFQISDPVEVVDRLRIRARKHDEEMQRMRKEAGLDEGPA